MSYVSPFDWATIRDEAARSRTWEELVQRLTDRGAAIPQSVRRGEPPTYRRVRLGCFICGEMAQAAGYLPGVGSGGKRRLCADHLRTATPGRGPRTNEDKACSITHRAERALLDEITEVEERLEHGEEDPALRTRLTQLKRGLRENASPDNPFADPEWLGRYFDGFKGTRRRRSSLW